MKSLVKLLYSPHSEKVKIEIPEFKKQHKGGCVIYTLANILSITPEEIAERMNKPLNYWFREEEILELEKVFPIRVEVYDREKVISSLKEGKPIIFCLEEHCVVCYGYELENALKFYIFDVNGKRKKMREGELKHSYIIYKS